MDPKNEKNVRTLHDLYAAVARAHSKGLAEKMQEAVTGIRPLIVTNMVKDDRDRNAGRIIQMVAQKYLTIQFQDLGAIGYDAEVESMVSQMKPLTQLSGDALARLSAERLVEGMVQGPVANGFS